MSEFARGSGLPIVNFGGNVRFTPRFYYAPKTEAEVLAVLDKHAQGKVRVIGALHSWSPAVVSDDVCVDLRHFDAVSIEQGSEGEVWATAGGGIRIKLLLRALHTRSTSTLPTLGLVTEQTIAGAISTGTHGSGKHCLSHYMEEIRIAAYDHETGAARVYVYMSGAELQAARCALGCMGIILGVRFRCIPQYDVVETFKACATLDEALILEEQFPLQQFFLLPHRWSYIVQCRKPITPAAPRQTFKARCYRAYWFIAIDIGLHATLKLLASILRSRSLVRLYYRYVVPAFLPMGLDVRDRSDRMLVMEHELFKHLEIELFVPAAMVRQAGEFLKHVVAAFDDKSATIPEDTAAALRRIGMYDVLLQHRGSFTLHYPVTFRRVLPGDTMMSMCSGSHEPYYAFSFITYVEPREPFYELASFLASSMAALFDARPHWGKYYPITALETERLYPRMQEFRQMCRQVDPQVVFSNAFTDRVFENPRAS